MRNFEIKFSGLKLGRHSFSFEIGDAFFHHTESDIELNSTISGGNLLAQVELDKKDSMLVFEFDIQGQVQVSCDLCMEPVQSEINTQRRIVGKFSDEETWHDDDIMHLPTSAYKIDTEELIYEFIHLALPSKNVHEEGKCDPEMIEKLEEYRIIEKEETSIDPRWEKLKNLK